MSLSPRVPFAPVSSKARRSIRRVDRSLRRSSTYPHPAGCVHRIETHLSIVFLAGRYAYKLFKPVKFDFVDLTRLARRRQCVQAEFTLNQALAKPLYLGVWPIIARGRYCVLGSDSHLRAGHGQRSHRAAVDYVVRMRRFDANAVLSARCARLDDGLADADALATRLAHYHLHAPRRAPRACYGSADMVQSQLQPLAAMLNRALPTELALRVKCEAELARIAPTLHARHANGFIRACHGDLHLDNIVRWRNQLLMFDCIEFDDSLRWIDVASDLAFALMDFTAHGREDCAHRLLFGWLRATGDYGALRVLPFYMAWRALVRALVTHLRGDDSACARYRHVAAECTRHMATARPSLLLCHGVSGSGKSLASVTLAQRLGAIHLSSDVERKRLADVPDSVRLPARDYAAARVDAIYDRLLGHAQTVLESGYTAIVDATFLRARNRDVFIALAHRLGIQVVILDFTADRATLFARVEARVAKGQDPSDAGPAVLADQLARSEPLTEKELALAVRFDTGVAPQAYDDHAFWKPLLEALRCQRAIDNSPAAADESIVGEASSDA